MQPLDLLVNTKTPPYALSVMAILVKILTLPRLAAILFHFLYPINS